MRNLAMLTTALLGLAYVSSSFAQPAESAPQPGLPPGASAGAINAQPPRSTGQISTTPTGVAPTPYASAPVATPRATRRVIRHRHRVYHRRHATHRAVAAPTDAPAQ